jgi:hypothetical protein
MKQPAELLADVRRRLERTWADAVLARDGDGAWPHDFPLGAPRGAELDRSGDLFAWARIWNEWVQRHGVDPAIALRSATRAFRSTRQTVPTHVAVSTVDAAARLVGGTWPATLAQGRERLAALRSLGSSVEPDRTSLRTINAYAPVDFALLLSAIAWFAEHPASGLTPRQVPIAGMHSKWLDSDGRRELISRLARLEGLGLDERRPHPVNVTYLDPAHRDAGRRRHDSIVPGDHAASVYPPRLVLICENRDSAVFFPSVRGALALQGAGNEGPTRIQELLACGWLPPSARLIYWGDLDMRGLEIVNGYRARGIPIETLLMDLAALHRYAAFGVNTSPSGAPLARGPQRSLSWLTAGERAAYEAIATDSKLPARVEQERIPLADALRELTARR